ncbi:hypothetical protein GGX14DRAFT_354560 [Mycena pura]|uniref:O-methyltransferase dimerisation domain-containing protein n=1 Tax=Mycena pura TaxID=153505 RepID=A0AAD6YK39_9AGAR|nr:hypothetical protein GGX14DRAFT_354560 [Mycena pura]
MDYTGLQTLRCLARIINESLDTMENAYSHAGQAIPTLDAPFDPENPAEAVRQEPAVATAILDIMAAASQMSATVCSPAAAVLNAAQAVCFHISSCLRAASELNVVEILREAGPQVSCWLIRKMYPVLLEPVGGRHVNQIATPSKADPALLARILRLLATHHIFSEVSPNVFANNRISSALDKGKPSRVLFEKCAFYGPCTSTLTMFQ